MGVTVTFDYTTWSARFPEFSATVTEATATTLFAEATIYHRNDGSGPVKDPNQQSILLNYVTAHLAQLYFPIETPSGGTPSQLVGRISNAGQGSVSVGTQNDYPPGTPQWWQQTKYGSSYWAATAGYRTFKYRRGCARIFDPYVP